MISQTIGKEILIDNLSKLYCCIEDLHVGGATLLLEVWSKELLAASCQVGSSHRWYIV